MRHAIVLAALFLCAFKAHAQCPVSFGAPAAYPAGTGVVDLVVADVNRDGRPDLLGLTNSSVVVLLGNGDGSFQPARVSPIGDASAFAFAMGDFNGDGFLDLAVTHLDSFWDDAGPDWLSILVGDGLGGFVRAARYSVGATPAAVVIADCDGDGVLDLVLATPNAQGLPVYRGVGDGTFERRSDIPTNDTSFRVYAGDFDGDSNADLVLIEPMMGMITLLRGHGNFSFGYDWFDPIVQFVLTAQSALVTDLDSDGLSDLVIPSSMGGLWTFMGDPTSEYGVFRAVGASILDNEAADVAVGHFNADGVIDIATCPGAPSIILRAENGPLGYQVSYSDPLGASRIVADDFDGDALSDVAYVNSEGDLVARLNTPGTTASIDEQPVDVVGCYWNAAVLSVRANFAFPTFQWQREVSPGSGTFVDVFDGPVATWSDDLAGAQLSGATAPRLGLYRGNNGEWGHAAGASPVRFRCVVFNSECGVLVSDSASVSISPCRVDLNCNGVIGRDDVVSFLRDFESTYSGLRADFNGDGAVDFFDYDELVQAVEAGC